MEQTLLRDSDWRIVDGEACRVTQFIPLARVEGERVIAVPSSPFASVHLECPKLPPDTVGFISHELDFRHLWAAFCGRGIAPDEEVIIYWTKRPLKGFAKVFSAFLPRLWVTVCKRGAYELITDPDSIPELQGEARFLAERPVVDWKPKIWGWD